ncbi:DUF4404 family protein [Brevibacillus laterosporus]|uniref:DUF4404 family protein n=1 Tax=Brevibacillus laterosporus TaxID=1465 RepID=UPI001F5AB0EB|nr:DUF4404 family protein [Brevibacillus laterosporus]
MKKLISASLAIALLVTAVPAVLAKEGDNGITKGKGKVEVEVSVDSKKNEEKEMKKEKTSEKEETTKNSSSAKPVLENVKLKKELIELRQELKHTTEISDEQKSKYETLVSELEKQTDISQAVEVQLELVERYYNKADRSSVDKLGKLLKKNGNTEITTLVDGKVITSDVKPFMQGGTSTGSDSRYQCGT